MSKPILNLNDSSKWQSRWVSTANAVGVANQPGSHYPIGKILCPILLESRILAVSITSSTAKAKWEYAGKARMKIQTGLTVGGSVDAASVSVKKLSLTNINVLVFPELASTYALEIEPIWWLDVVSIVVWEYVGIDSDTATAQLDRIELAVDNLNR